MYILFVLQSPFMRISNTYITLRFSICWYYALRVPSPFIYKKMLYMYSICARENMKRFINVSRLWVNNSYSVSLIRFINSIYSITFYVNFLLNISFGCACSSDLQNCLISIVFVGIPMLGHSNLYCIFRVQMSDKASI